MQTIPLRAIPNQTVSVILGAQNVQIDVYQKRVGLFVNVYIDGAIIVAGVLAQNLRRLVRDAYHGLKGDLTFVDMQGADSPHYTGIGTRYSLVYLEDGEASTSPFAP